MKRATPWFRIAPGAPFNLAGTPARPGLPSCDTETPSSSYGEYNVPRASPEVRASVNLAADIETVIRPRGQSRAVGPLRTKRWRSQRTGLRFGSCLVGSGRIAVGVATRGRADAD